MQWRNLKCDADGKEMGVTETEDSAQQHSREENKSDKEEERRREMEQETQRETKEVRV